MALSGNQLTRIGDMGTPGRAYAGFAAKNSSAIVLSALEYTAPVNRAHYTIEVNRAHYTIEDND